MIMLPKIFRAPPDVTGDMGGGSGGELFVLATPDQVILPEGFNPADADFVRAGPDLMLTAPDGTQVLVADFFMMEMPPALLGEDGARVAGDLAVRLAGSATPGQVAGEAPDLSDVIGRVTNLNGEVTVIRADGSRMTLQTGDVVYQGDILETGLEAGIGVLLADGTSLSMGEGARMILDEMVYDPDTQEGNIALSVMKGVFTIVSGEISKTSPEAMMIHTPVATIGIRGTQIGLDFANGKDLTLVMMEEADGFVGEVMIINDGGAMTLNQAYFAVTVNAYAAAPVAAPVFSIDDIAVSFGGALMYLPIVDTNANDYGQQSGLAVDAASFETAAGDMQLGEEGLAKFETVEDQEPSTAAETLAAFDTAAGDEGVDVEDGLAMFESIVEEALPPVDAVTSDGLADFETVVAEEPTPPAREDDVVEEQPPADDASIAPTGVDLTAEDLAVETDVIFGEEIVPTETPEVVTPPPADEMPVETEGPLEPVFEPEQPVVEPLNVAPIAEPGTAITAEDNVFRGQLTASDLEGGALTYDLADGGDAEHGTVTVNSDGTFTYVPNTDFGGTDSFTYMVTDDAGATALATVSVTVTPVADVPQIAAANVSGYEDSAIALTLAATMPATTQETVERISITGVPDGASLSAGTDNGDGTWDLLPNELSGLSLNPPKDFSGSFELGVKAISSDGGTAVGSFGLHVSPVADVPQLAVADVSGAEDAGLLLSIATAMPGGTGETVASVLLTGVPEGASLSAGVDNGDGTWSLSPDELGSLTLTPPSDYNGVFDIGVSVTSSDGGVATDTFAVNVNPVADTPVIATVDVSGNEDSAIALTLAASMPAGTTETLADITVTGVPAGAVLSAGTDNGDGTWTLGADELSGLSLTPPTDYNGTFNLGVVATSTDGATASSDLGVTVLPLADVPQLALADAVGAEDGSIALTLAASMPAGTNEALHTITIDGVPDGATLSAGIDNGDGSWIITPDLMAGLTLTPPTDFNGSFDLTVTAVSTDGGTATGSMGVNITPVADIPVIALTDASGAEDTTITLTIAASMPGGTAESVDSIIVTGVPDGAVLSAGTDNGDGSWTLSRDNLVDLTITPPADFNGAFNLGVSVTSTDGGVASGTMAVSVGAVSDIPVIAVGDVSGTEDSSIALTVAASMPANTTETLENITIAGVPEGALLSAGTNNGNGTWTVSASDLAGLTLTPPQDFSGVLNMTVTAVSSDGGTSTSGFNVSVTSVPDVPQVVVGNVSGNEDTAITLDISADMAAGTSETISSILLSGVPDGASLSAGTDNGDGTWTLTADQLDGLSLTPPAHFSGTIDLGVRATSSDGGTAISSASVAVGPVADAPVLSVSIGEGVTTPATSDMTLENLGSSAGFDNTIGYYTLDENGMPSVGHIIWANVKDNVGDSFSLEDLDPDAFGVFLLSDGAGENDGLFNGQSVSFAQDADGNWQAYDSDGEVLAFDPRGGLFFTHEDFNTGGVDYEMDTAAPGNMNWEDLIGGGDQDFNDVNLNITWSPDTVTTTYDLYITAGLVDADGSESLAITVAGVPVDATLSAGTNNGDGTWTLMPDELSGLSLTVPGSVIVDFSLQVTATATESDGSEAATSASIVVDVPILPDVVVEDVSGLEDTAIVLDITASDAEIVTISGVPDGAELSVGTLNDDGTWTLLPDQLDGLSLTPPQNYSGTIALSVTGTSSDGSVDQEDFTVSVGGVADVPSVSIEIGPGVAVPAASTMTLENLGSSAGFDNTIGYYTLDESGEPITGQIIWANVKQDVGVVFTLEGVDPENIGIFLLSDGDRENEGLFDGQSVSFSADENGNWQVFDMDGNQLAFDPLGGLFFSHAVFNTGGADYVADTAAPGNMNWEDLIGGGDQAFNDVNMNIGWSDSAPATTYDLTITSALADVDGSETLSLTLSGLPLDAVLSAGTDNGDGTWTLSPEDVVGLSLTVPGDVVNDFTLYVTATATETGGSQASATDSALVDISVAPDLVVDDVSGAEDNAIALDITATVAGETQSLESVTLSGVPDGATLSAGTDNGDGTWTLLPDQLDGLTLTPPMDFSGSIALGVSATSTDGVSSHASFSIDVMPMPDAPIISVANVGGGEDTALTVSIAVTMPDTTSETVESILITGVPTGAELSAGFMSGDGEWRVSPTDLDGLTLTPPSNFSGVIQLGVVAVSTDGGTSSSSFSATITPVADEPVLQVSDVVVTLEAPPGEEIDGTRGADELYGTYGADEIDGDSGHDVIYGDSDRAPSDDEEDDDGGRGHGHGHGRGRDDDDDEGGAEDDGGTTEAITVALDVDAALSDIDGSEALSISVAGVPDGASLSLGSDNGDGSWTLLADDLSHLDDLTMTLPAGSPTDGFTLDITASSSEIATGDTASTTAAIDVTFDASAGGDDIIDGGKGNDLIYGGGGGDEIDGGKGHDEIYGEAGDDEIEGGKGSDALYGGEGDDTIDGGDSADLIVGGAGDDVLEGGKGADEFVFHAGDGDDIVLDLSHQDVLRFEGQEFNMDDFILQSDEENETTTITFGADAGVSVTLNDVEVEPGSGYTVTQDGDSVVVTFDRDSID